MNRLIACLACLFGFLAAPASAQLAQPGVRNMAVELVAESDAPRSGDTVTLALAMRPNPGWHGYWKNPGDAGAETRVAWRLPPGAAAGELRYPVPDRLTVAGLMNYVFKGPYAHLVDLRIPEGLARGTPIPIRARVDYLVCTEEICVPEQADVALDLRVGEGAVASDRRARFDAWRRAMPRPLGAEGRFESIGGRFRLAVPLPTTVDVEDPYFFPLTDAAIDHGARQAVSRNGEMLILETDAGRAADGLPELDGVLRIGSDAGLSFSALPGPVPSAGTPIEARARAGGPATILLALLGAVVGGLILNIMPCVFPILSLKALSLVRAGEDERSARREALAYGAGAVLTALALGGALLALRAAGAAVGWAFQLQDPRVILFLLLLVTAIALNLAGLFRLPAAAGGESLARSGGTRGAFWTGALAAFVATPCTGPFMGAALGAALVLPALAALAIFAGLGFGLALPFLLLGFVPAFRRMLPKPGPWMERFQRILSVPMFATALGLAWILGRQAGVDGMTLGLGAATVLGLGLWWYGTRQGGGRAWPVLIPALALAVASLTIVRPAPAEPAGTAGYLAAEPFSEARLADLRAEGRPVFVYFTADWCITCKVNEQGAMARAEVATAFARHNMAVLVGDWTNGDPVIGRFLERHGRSGVPLYLYYPSGGGPEILPQILTVGRLTALGA